MNQGRCVFAQLTELLPRRAFENAVVRRRGDRRVRSLSCMDQLLSMVFAQLTGRSSLRETVSCLWALGGRRYHCGIRGHVARSTLAEANEKRDYRIFRDAALAMVAAARMELPVDAELARLEADAYALDSTTIDLCLRLFPWAHFRRRKAGIKAHATLDLHTGIPVFVRVTHAKTHDLWALDQMAPQGGAFYVIDKGYIDFARLHRLHSAGAFFVTRAKTNMDFGVRQRLPVKADAGVASDRLIRLRGPKSRWRYPDTLRLIRYTDRDTGKRLTFLTNNTIVDALTVALLYRKRWKVELFFKWIKQHLHIKAFFGTSPNAVKTQVWIAMITYLLVLRLKHRHRLAQDPNQILQILSITILEKTTINELFSKRHDASVATDRRNQLALFEI
jgi:IS4 transposase